MGWGVGGMSGEGGRAESLVEGVCRWQEGGGIGGGFGGTGVGARPRRKGTPPKRVRPQGCDQPQYCLRREPLVAVTPCFCVGRKQQQQQHQAAGN